MILWTGIRSTFQRSSRRFTDAERRCFYRGDHIVFLSGDEGLPAAQEVFLGVGDHHLGYSGTVARWSVWLGRPTRIEVKSVAYTDWTGFRKVWRIEGDRSFPGAR